MLNLILPRRCPYCEQVMLPQEQGVCLRCLAELPRVHAEGANNEVERRIFGRIPFEHATSFCYYTSEGPFGGIIRRSKFGNQPWYNAHLTRLFVQELSLSPESGWPYDIDVIVPVPLHFIRLMLRGYNQVMPIAETLSDSWHLPIETQCLYKRRYTTTQVGLSAQERRSHEEGSFGVRHPERLAGRHVLLVDDVLTTGATLMAASDALLAAAPGIRISILTLSLAQS